MEILRRSEFKTMRWPNGQGVAHEIFLEAGGERPLWRVSLAEVVGECVFSKFEGMTRNTTVVSGAGMDLTAANETIALRSLQPVSFSGELPLTGTLVDGPVENLNVVFDASKFHAEVRIETAPLKLPLFLEDVFLMFVLDGDVECHGQSANKGDCLRGLSGSVGGSGTGVLIRLIPLEKTPKGRKTGG